MIDIKKTVSATIVTATVLASCPMVMADGISVVLDGQNLSFDVAPQIISDRTMVPLRAIFEALGASVEWDDGTRTVTSALNGTTVSLTVDDSVMYVNGQTVPLDAPACIVDGRTLVPVRAISEAYGANVTWDGSAQTVYIASNGDIAATDPFEIVKNWLINNGVYTDGTYASAIDTNGSLFYLGYIDTDDTITYTLNMPADDMMFRLLMYNNGGDPAAIGAFEVSTNTGLVGTFDSSSQQFTVVVNQTNLPVENAIQYFQGTFNNLLDTLNVILSNINPNLTYSNFGFFKITESNVVDATNLINTTPTEQTNNYTVSSQYIDSFNVLKNIIINNGTALDDGSYYVALQNSVAYVFLTYCPHIDAAPDVESIQFDTVPLAGVQDNNMASLMLYSKNSPPVAFVQLDGTDGALGEIWAQYDSNDQKFIVIKNNIGVSNQSAQTFVEPLYESMVNGYDYALRSLGLSLSNFDIMLY